jgi:hypothetical protein
MGSVTSIKTRRAPEDDRLSHTFTGAEDFAALRQAEAYLEARGFSFGQMQGSNPIAIMLGADINIGKWRNLSPEEQNDADGQITSENFRKGPVTISIRPDAPARVIEAFTADVEESGSNVVPLHGTEAADAHPVIDPPGLFIGNEPHVVRVTVGMDAVAQSAVEHGRRR